MTFDSSLDALLGTSEPSAPPPKKKGGRPRIHPPRDPSLPKRPVGRPKTRAAKIELPEIEVEEVEEVEEIEEVEAPPPPRKTKSTRIKSPEFVDIGDWAEALRPVSLTWLARAFRVPRDTVKSRLATLEPVGSEGGQSKLYDFVQAASYLVKPKNIDEYIKGLKPSELPANLRKETYQALIMKQRYMKAAGELWHTSDVFEVFGEAMKHIKENMQVWVDKLDRVEGLSTSQRDMLVELVDELQGDIHTSLVKMQEEKETPSSAADDAELLE